MTSRQAPDLSINVFEPLVTGGAYRETLTDQLDSYQHEIRALGGYWTGTFTLKDRLTRIEDWLDRGLGRHIVTRDDALNVIWEGFVNRVSANLGPLSVVRGPLLEIANRVACVYSAIDATTSPPTLGLRVKTSTTNDTPSQAKYGIVQVLLSAAGMTATEAAQVRDTYLAEHVEPETSKSLSLGNTSEPSVTIECCGYVRWLDAYIFNQTAATGTQDLDEKIRNILTADPNDVISTDYSRIAANTLAVPKYENDDMRAWSLIKALVAEGDASDNRYLFGIYQDRQAVYAAAPTTIAYQQRLADPEQRFETLAGGIVKPWNILPGKWLFFPDLLIGKSQPADLREEPRAMFIESVTYSAPWGLSLSGGKLSAVDQRLARLGLAGIGA